MSKVQPHLINREKFLQALESGKHKQICKRFRGFGFFRRSYCAIGLALHTVDPSDTWYHDDTSVYENMAEYYKMPVGDIGLIITLNDTGMSFANIAKTLRHKWSGDSSRT